MNFTPSAAPVQVSVTTDPAVIQELALATWQTTYQHILAQAQIEYMLQTFYTQEALQQQMGTGQTFLLASQAGVPVAFAAFSCSQPQENLYKLNKLYIHPEYQGLGVGRLLLEEVVSRAKTMGGKELELNVHRLNPAFYFYKRHGFTVHLVADIPLGDFVLNDYILRRPL
ncbi:GNAT family N-acetyltransferase [Rufibacter sp. LB8]|uniref:GNAT family N-acetyltransferase n=1 Tax=Rufibacter sp. LB8 TaxID=2777781 RepID=UPI00178C1FE7|nr:GNAT family N-acetyltransferase [Rufibacter sp. LB8]